MTNCYGPHYRRHEYQDRQSMLREQYGFRCVCRACSDPADRVYMQSFTAVQCQACSGPVLDNKCQECQASSDQSQVSTRMLDNCHDIVKLRQLEQSWSKVLYKHHQSLAEARDRLAKLELEEGNIEECVRLLELGLEYTEARYGEDSVEMGHELMKYSDVLFIQLQHGGKSLDKLSEALHKANRIFTLQNGFESKVCREIGEKIKLIKS